MTAPRKPIPRYDMVNENELSNGGETMELRPLGDYVEYTDHLAAMQRERQCRALLVARLQNLVTAICKVQDWDGTRVGSALDDVDAALAAAKELK